MAWIESHQSLATHRKTMALEAALSVTTPQAVGHLHLLWWWALDNAPTGDLTHITDAVVARVCQWPGDAMAFVTALTDCGFLDRSPRAIHDWDDYAGKLLRQRQANAARQRAFRDKTDTNEPRNTHVTVTSPLRNPATVPNSTVPNSTVPKVSAFLKGGNKKDMGITPEFIEQMVVEWSAKLGGEQVTRDTIELALNHKAADKYKNKRLYLKGWLRRDSERLGNSNGKRPPLTKGNIDWEREKRQYDTAWREEHEDEWQREFGTTS